MALVEALLAAVSAGALIVGFSVLNGAKQLTASARDRERELLAMLRAERIRSDGREEQLRNQLLYAAGKPWEGPPIAQTPPPRRDVFADISLYPEFPGSVADVPEEIVA